MSRVTPSSRISTPARGPRRSFTLIEAVISIVITSVLLVAALNTVGAAAISRRSSAQRAIALGLAEDLMAEILENDYEDPEDAPAPLGPDTGESTGGSRTTFDDVDDFTVSTPRPIEDRNGATISGYTGWTRMASVKWVSRAAIGQTSVVETGVKRIKVIVEHDGDPVVEMCALRTQGWPVASTVPGPIAVLLVTKDPSPGPEDLARQALMESWGWTVTLIEDSDTQANFDTAAASVDVAYLAATVRPNDVGTKLQNATIGVVVEHGDLYDEFGIAERVWETSNVDDIAVIDDTHYITSVFTTGSLVIYTSNQTLPTIDGQFAIAPGLQVLAEEPDGNSDPALSVLETGAQAWGGGTAPGRRVHLPWGNGAFAFATDLNDDGRTLMKRAVEWAAGREETGK